jgi:outer membrane biosynthesis protein TonB
MVIYLLLVNLAVIISYSLYYFSFRKLTFFQWNRVYLLCTAFFALLIPIGLFIDLSTFFEDDIIIPMVNVHEFIDIPIVVYAQQNSSLYLLDVLKWIYLTGLIVSAGVMLWRLWNVYKMFKSDAPFLGFSFFNKMFLGKAVKSYKSIERHEQIHIEQGHSYDVLFMEIFKALNWFNPVVYHMTKEIKFQHECIADELSSEDKVAYAELLVAHAFKVPQNVLVHEFSNQSFLKKRIMMLFKNKSSKNKRFLYLGIIPAVLVVGLSTLVFNTSRAKTVVAKVESKMEDVKLPASDISSIENQDKVVQLPNIEIINPISQIVANDTIKEGGNEVFVTTEINPEPPGGMQAFLKWIGENYEFPQEAIDAGVKGSILTSFIVEKDGSLSNLKVMRDLSYNTGRRAIEMLKKSPKWSPAIQNGRKVRCEFTLPIRLDLTNMGEVQERLPRAEPVLGYNELRKWINSHFTLPRALNSKDVDPFVYLKFGVDPDGKITPNGAQSDLGIEFIAELSKHIRNSEWIPATMNGKKVRSEGSIWIKFDRSGKIIEDYTRVEIQPDPKGDVSAFRKFIALNYKFPTTLLDKKESGNVEVKFEIDGDGNPTNITVLKESHKDIGQQLESLIKKNGTWSPAIIDGKKMKFAFSMSINLKYAEGVGVIDVGNLKSLGFIKS